MVNDMFRSGPDTWVDKLIATAFWAIVFLGTITFCVGGGWIIYQLFKHLHWK